MPYVSLYRKYRSQSFAEISGQEHVTRTLGNAIRADRVGHAYLFCGPRGTGKTSVARLLAKCLNCVEAPTLTPCNACPSCVEINAGITGASFNVQEFDAASKRSIDDIRHLRDTIGTGKWGAGEAKTGRKVVIIDEVHMLTTEAFNALLKTLEEPPEHVLFVLATTDVHKVPATIVSRCQRFDFRRGSQEQIEERLRFVAQEEGVSLQEAAAERIARAAGGSWRDALSLLEQVLAYSGETITGADVTEVLGTVDEEELARLAGAVAAGDGAALFAVVDRLISAGRDVRQLTRDLTEYFRQLLLVAVGAAPRESAPAEQTRLASELGVNRLVAALELLSGTEREFRESDQLRLILEVALVRLSHLTELGAAPGQPGRVTAPEREGALGNSEAPRGAASRPPPAEPISNKPAPDAARREPRPPKPDTDSRVPLGDGRQPERAPVDAVPSEPRSETVDLDTIRRRWHVFIEELRRRRRKSTAALVAEATPTRLDGTTLVLSFEYEMHVQLIQRPDDRKHLEEALAAVYGARLQIAGEVGREHAPVEEAETRPLPPPKPSVRDVPADGNGAAGADNSRLVHDVIEIFDGTILEDEPN